MIKVTRLSYRDMTSCCGESLFEKSSVLKNTARDDMALDDIGYIGRFPVDWKYCDGYEAPMAVYNYNELWVGAGGQFEELPLKHDHVALDWFTHFPYDIRRGYFFAVTKHHHRGQWRSFLNTFKRDDDCWQLVDIQNLNWARPIQFWNGGNDLILQRDDAVALLNLDTFKIRTIFDSGPSTVTNCHLTECATRIGCVTVKGTKAASLRLHLIDKAGGVVTLKEGINRAGSIGSLPLILPLRVDNGMVQFEFR